MKSAYDDRIIPAYAGSTFVFATWSAKTADHPRIRGEHIVKSGVILTTRGSSPHTRGALAKAVLL